MRSCNALVAEPQAKLAHDNLLPPVRVASPCSRYIGVLPRDASNARARRRARRGMTYSANWPTGIQLLPVEFAVPVPDPRFVAERGAVEDVEDLVALALAV